MQIICLLIKSSLLATV